MEKITNNVCPHCLGESDGLTYLSYPPQNKCKNCGQFWYITNGEPKVEIKSFELYKK
jgi:hypothetical protein